MKMRLFWKILVIFWLIFYAVFQLAWIGFTFYSDYKTHPIIEHMPTKVDMIAQLLHFSGEDEALSFITHLPKKEQALLSVELIPAQNDVNNSTKEEVKRSSYSYRRVAIAPDGTSYVIRFSNDKLAPKEEALFKISLPIFLIGISVGLFSSLFLAWNLTRPMNLFKQGFFRVSQGDLTFRLHQKLAGRHDELSDLGKDFDIMVEQLNILRSSRQMLLHDVSHELRTPLARLQLAIGLAQQNKQNIEDALARIELESQRLDQLIGEILSSSRAEMNDQNTDDYFDLKDLLTLLVCDANYESNQLSIIVNFTVHSVVHSIVMGNAEQIRRAIENIIRNAIRFSKAGQEIDISLKEVGKYLQIEVNDNGPGVDEVKLTAIFEPFVRIQPAQQGKGYGLGLAIAKKTITMHSGSIVARNRDCGGLSVKIELPYWMCDKDSDL